VIERLSGIRHVDHVERHGKRSRVHQNAEHEDHVQRITHNVNLELTAISYESTEVAAHLLIASKATDANLSTCLFYVSPKLMYSMV